MPLNRDRTVLTETKFVQAEQSLFNTLIGKAGLANTVPFIGAPLQAITRALENVHDVGHALKTFYPKPREVLLTLIYRLISLD